MCPDPLPPWELTCSCDALTHEPGYFYTEMLLLTYFVTSGTFWVGKAVSRFIHSPYLFISF